MELLELFSKLIDARDNYEPYSKPRRVFTRGFIMLCVMVAVFELVLLNHIYSGR